MSRASDDTREHKRTQDEIAGAARELPRPALRLRGLVDRLVSGSGPRTLAPPTVGAGECRVLGRANSCDYVIYDPTVSSRHAELVRLDDDGWLIRDLGSRNGTRVNGWLVKEQRLRDGDTLTFGGSVFLFDAH